LIIVKIEKSFRGYGAYFKDSQGFKTIFSERNSLDSLKRSIKEHMEGMGILHYEIKKVIYKEDE
jgi:hypothetical protein